jgi:hypothetical protein
MCRAAVHGMVYRTFPADCTGISTRMRRRSVPACDLFACFRCQGTCLNGLTFAWTKGTSCCCVVGAAAYGFHWAEPQSRCPVKVPKKGVAGYCDGRCSSCLQWHRACLDLPRLAAACLVLMSVLFVEYDAGRFWCHCRASQQRWSPNVVAVSRQPCSSAESRSRHVFNIFGSNCCTFGNMLPASHHRARPNDDHPVDAPGVSIDSFWQ